MNKYFQSMQVDDVYNHINTTRETNHNKRFQLRQVVSCSIFFAIIMIDQFIK